MISTTILSGELAGAETVQPVDLRCEYRVGPVGIDVSKPGLSWRMEAEAPGQRQTAYQVLVASSTEQLDRGVGDLWDSGKVVSDQSQHVRYAGGPLKSNTACYWKVRVWDKDGRAGAWSPTARWTMGLLTDESWTAQWIGTTTVAEEGDPAGVPTPLLRQEFELAEAPAFAQVTVHAPGYFELYINGEKVGEDVLTPAVSNLELRTFCVSYDVARHLRARKNCIGLWLGKGWTDRMVVRAQLDAVVHGEPVVVGTGTSWQTHDSGRYRIGGNKWDDFGGERVDARETIDGWSRPGFDASDWHAVVDARPPKGPLRAQPCPLNRLGESVAAVGVKPLDGGRYQFDFGTNLTGWLRLKMPRLAPGTVVSMTFADVGPDGNLKQKGKYQDFNQVSEFVSSGKPEEVFEHKFNYAGFRYVIVSGLPEAPAKENAESFMVESDLEEVGAFACSNDLLNRIHQINKWTQRALDLGGYYVDCPHRERMGYGDGQVAAEGFMTSFRADGFYRKWLEDWRLLQQPDGGLPNSAPFGKGGGGPGWGGLLSAFTWRHYLYYGDRRILEENYDAVRRYVDSLENISASNNDILTGKTGKFSFIGDWVAPRRGMDTDNAPSHEARELFNNCYRVNQLELLVRIAKVLAKPDDAERYGTIVDRIRPKIHEAFYDAAKQQYVLDDQAYYVMPLMTGVTPQPLRPQILDKLEHGILVKNKGHLDTGMLGTYFMMEYLRQIGRNDLVFTMFNQKTYPGWGYMLEQGATTLWEQWNGYWSQIHSCFTSPCNWLYQGLAGIQADPAAPGFKNIIIKPAMVGDVTWVNAHHDSPYGRIVSNWERDGDRVTMTVTIPANTTATIFVPAEKQASIAVNGQALEKAQHVSFVKIKGNQAVLHADAGNYNFTSRIK